MAVFVLDKNQKPLMPCIEKRARLLLVRKKARIHSMYPFTIRLTCRTVQQSSLQPLRCKIDPGSKVTGIAVVREDAETQVVVSLIELTHRGEALRKTLQARASKRKRRRSTLRYRCPRFANRTKPIGWLPPSLHHRLETTMTWVNRLKNRTPVVAITCERVRFDIQKLENPDIQNIEYSQGTLLGYEIREYLLEKWGRMCAYCDIQDVPLQIDHVVPKSRGGSNRIANLTLACAACNQKKGNLSLKVFSSSRVAKITSGTSFKDAAAVNSTRNALWKQLTALSIPCEPGTGGETKYNRNRLGIPKTHALDAACTGTVSSLKNWCIPILQIRIQTANSVVQGIHSKHSRLVQHADGYHYLGSSNIHLNQKTEEQRFLPALKGQVSALSIG